MSECTACKGTGKVGFKLKTGKVYIDSYKNRCIVVKVYGGYSFSLVDGTSYWGTKVYDTIEELSNELEDYTFKEVKNGL